MIKNKLQEDQKKAMKASEKEKVMVLRYVLSRIKNLEIEKQRELSDEEIVRLLRKIVKEIKEVIEVARKAKRSNIVKENEFQYKVISSYLPPEISDAKLREEIEKMINKNREVYKKNPQALIGVCVKELREKASPQRIVKLYNLYYLG